MAMLRKWLPFEEARAYVHTLNLKDMRDWWQWRKSPARPLTIPTTPEKIYRGKGWVHYADWLGNGRLWGGKYAYRSFHSARDFARALHLSGVSAWYVWARTTNRPVDIPIAPDLLYTNKGWISWGDFLGTNSVATFLRVYLPFEEARRTVQSLGIKTQNEWHLYTKNNKLPDGVPSTPEKVYKGSGWISLGHWLGTRNISYANYKFLSFDDARAIVRGLQLGTSTNWHAWLKSSDRDQRIPTNPHRHYRYSGWIDMPDWLGTRKNGRRFTIIEVMTANALDKLGVSYETQKHLGSYWIDIFIPPNTVIECDGTYWHSRVDSIAHNKVRDKWLDSHGYIVHHLPEEVIKDDVDKVLRDILRLA